MLFNSFPFLFIFLPVTLAIWHMLRCWAGLRVALCWLIFASLFFYAAWDIRYLGILLTSIALNYWLGGLILAARQQNNETTAKRWMIVGVSFNLLVLCGFKYTYFLAANLLALFNTPVPFDPIILPLAISFVTFQKIAYLVDCRRGLVTHHDALNYMFFVSFFPQLIAGPIVHHKPLIMQTITEHNSLFGQTKAGTVGLSFLAMGLFKKVVLADTLARYASPVFELAKHSIPSGEAAWQAMLAYTLQLYFDFSGYSDMAIGLALLFGFKLPINFASPYKAYSIIDFWRRWHISLSCFLRDYLYIPLGGNRNGVFMRYRNLALTMLLAGLWHGAGWNFILWGILHGNLLLLNYAWRNLLTRWQVMAMLWQRVPLCFSVALTFILVALAWVLFRAPDLSTAHHLYTALLQSGMGNALPSIPWQSGGHLLENIVAASPDVAWLWITTGLLIVFLMPNTTQLIAYDPTPNSPITTNTGFVLGLLLGCGLWLSLKWMAVSPASEFLYFNF
jgi:D-alanyl-lipoteichoic acid acyltransferase DltB (MBOAT superfamily)